VKKIFLAGLVYLAMNTTAFACVMPGSICSSISDVCCVGGGYCGSSMVCPTGSQGDLEKLGLKCATNTDGSFTCAPKTQADTPPSVDEKSRDSSSVEQQ
jgi:hypothetical protein